MVTCRIQFGLFEMVVADHKPAMVIFYQVPRRIVTVPVLNNNDFEIPIGFLLREACQRAVEVALKVGGYNNADVHGDCRGRNSETT